MTTIQTASLSSETNLVGKIVSSELSTTGLTVYVQFEDKVTLEAREPQATTKIFTLDKGNSRAETIYADSHTTTDGITTITINANGRNIAKYGYLSGSGTGNRHPMNAEVGCVNIHLYNEVVSAILKGEHPTMANLLKMGDGTASDIKLEFTDDEATPSFIIKDSATGKILMSHNGVDTFDPQMGGSGVTAGDGLKEVASDLSVDTADTAVFVKTSSGASDEDKVPVLNSSGVVDPDLINAVDTSAGAGDTGKVVKLDSSGKIDATMLTGGFETVDDHYIYTPAYLTTGTSATANYLLWLGTTDGSFACTIDGTARSITGLDFTGASDMDDIASIIQTGIRAITSGLETCVWSTDHFVITSGDTTSSSAITVLSAVGSGTDISGIGAGDPNMDGDTGSATDKAINNSADSGKIPKLNSEGNINRTLLQDFDAKGDLLAGSGNGTGEIVSTGENGMALISDDTETTGMRWNFPLPQNFSLPMTGFGAAGLVARNRSDNSLYTLDFKATSCVYTKYIFDTDVNSYLPVLSVDVASFPVLSTFFCAYGNSGFVGYRDGSANLILYRIALGTGAITQITGSAYMSVYPYSAYAVSETEIKLVDSGGYKYTITITGTTYTGVSGGSGASNPLGSMDSNDGVNFYSIDKATTNYVRKLNSSFVTVTSKNVSSIHGSATYNHIVLSPLDGYAYVVQSVVSYLATGNTKSALYFYLFKLP